MKNMANNNFKIISKMNNYLIKHQKEVIWKWKVAINLVNNSNRWIGYIKSLAEIEEWIKI